MQVSEWEEQQQASNKVRVGQVSTQIGAKPSPLCFRSAKTRGLPGLTTSTDLATGRGYRHHTHSA